MKTALVYPCPGELGWLACNFVPHVRQVVDTERPQRAIVHVRASYEALYEFATDIETFDYHADCTEGNAFVLSRPDAYKTYKAHVARCEAVAESLRASGDVVVVRLPASKYRYHRFKDRCKLFVPLKAMPIRDDLVGAVVFHVRWLTRSPQKNTRPEMLTVAAEWAHKTRVPLVVVGRFDKSGGAQFVLRDVVNFTNSTTVGELIALIANAALVVGSSSGPMHLAALARTPHVVWGGGRNDVVERYQKKWNPFDTPVRVLSKDFGFKDAKKLRNAISELYRIRRSGGRG